MPTRAEAIEVAFGARELRRRSGNGLENPCVQQPDADAVGVRVRVRDPLAPEPGPHITVAVTQASCKGYRSGDWSSAFRFLWAFCLTGLPSCRVCEPESSFTAPRFF